MRNGSQGIRNEWKADIKEQSHQKRWMAIAGMTVDGVL